MFKYRVFSGPYFPTFWLNTARYSVFSQNGRKYEPEKTPYLDTFHAVISIKSYVCTLKGCFCFYYCSSFWSFHYKLTSKIKRWVRNVPLKMNCMETVSWYWIPFLKIFQFLWTTWSNHVFSVILILCIRRNCILKRGREASITVNLLFVHVVILLPHLKQGAQNQVLLIVVGSILLASVSKSLPGQH